MSGVVSARGSGTGPGGGAGIHHLVEKQAQAAPDRPAVVTEEHTVSYGELDGRADRLGRQLLEGGLRPGGIVAVSTGRPEQTLVAVLAVLKAGGAYVLVDPHGPTGRTGQLLQRAGATAVVTYEAFRPHVDDGSGRRVVCLDSEATAIDARSGKRLNMPSGPAAAVLLTAGASGERRAVAVGHARLRAAYEGWAEVYQLVPGDRHLVTAPPDTAAFTGGWVRALCSGATLLLPGLPVEADSWDPEATVLDTDPATAAELLRSRPADSLRLVVVSGERLTVAEQVRLHRRLVPGARLLNVYGPAETAGCGTWFEPDQLTGPVPRPERVSLLGRPFPGCHVEIHKGEIRLTPPDGGDALPTGDLGLLREDGLLEFRGRLAHRFTVRGRTVDPHRAEAALASHPGVREAVITAVPADGGAQQRERLVAHVVAPRGETAPGAEVIRAHLTGEVPEAEIPGTVVALPSLPRDRAGKIDRRALPQPPSAPGGRGGKGGGQPMTKREARSCFVACALPVIAIVAAALTDVLWPGSTDLTGVPGPWSVLFRVLYFAECLAFAAGVTFLVGGRAAMLRQGRTRRLTVAAHLAIVWLLAAWWPQDNLYRLAAKTDWPRQAALVYVFNVPLMIAAAVVAVWATRRPATANDDTDG
ncbi:AMP-binding protein [Streptomyces sp. T028]|uniref:AMP-binding protein n=1 Tax=Streptomyces sp. T028 TaxID=3394379 RepID=UPI003A88F692